MYIFTNIFVQVFDYTIDSSGLMLLICPYKLENTKWLLIILLELSIYGALGLILDFYLSSNNKIIIFIIINFIFTIYTYLNDPYTQKIDKILDFISRGLVTIIGIGHLIIRLLKSPKFGENREIENNDLPLYNPAKAYEFFFKLDYSNSVAYLIIDAIMVIYMYIYIYYIFNEIGTFSYFQKRIKNMKYIMHDHIFSFLMSKIKLTTLGFENIYTGKDVCL
jgi:hypothetical protein